MESANKATLTNRHYLLLVLSCSVIASQLGLLIYYWEEITNWLSHNLWVVVIPFLKVLLKRILALKLVAFLKAVFFLSWNFSKLLILKLLKTLGVRYGVFFSQNRWYTMRKMKVMYLRRGRQFFRALGRFWSRYQGYQRWIIMIAFAPIVLLLFLLGLSFQVTRKTMVKKAQESAIFEVTKTATNSRGIRAWIQRLDKVTLQKIRELTPRGQSVEKKP